MKIRRLGSEMAPTKTYPQNDQMRKISTANTHLTKRHKLWDNILPQPKKFTRAAL